MNRDGSSFVVFLCLLYLHQGSTIPTTQPPSPVTLQEAFVTTAELLHSDVEEVTETVEKVKKPEIYNFNVRSDVQYRYATTVVTSRIANPSKTSQEVFFSVVLPEKAFISRFLMEVNGKVYEAYVKEKEAAKHEYQQAIESGQTAAHVSANARDSNKFTVSLNVEAQGKVTFNLTYEELLERRLGKYEQIINLHPGQVVRDFNVDVYIKESQDITVINVPELRSGNEINPDEKENPLAKIEQTSPKEAHVHFSPSLEEQKKLSKKATGEKQNEVGEEENGLGGQFVVQYDVERKPTGEVLIVDGYFVHFFAPSDLPPLQKHVIFVLDLSGSMWGRKIEQLKDAMLAILDDLNEGDYFNLIEFSNSVSVWDPEISSDTSSFEPYVRPGVVVKDSGNEQHSRIFPANAEFISKAKEHVRNMTAGGGTNIHGAVLKALKLAVESKSENFNNTRDEEQKPEPTIVFLTDGEPTVGETNPQRIAADISDANAADKISIFSLAFGDGADYNFLKKLSLQNDGFARRIYEASDANLQLKDFYAGIASPLLSNVTFNYGANNVDWGTVTKRKFHTFFKGSEIVVAGKLENGADVDFSGEVKALSSTGAVDIPISHVVVIDHIDRFLPYPQPVNVTRNVGFLEKLWAYLQIKQLLEEDAKSPEVNKEPSPNEETTTTAHEVSVKSQSPKEKALKLALEYSFVTPLTSLVVVKPNETVAADAEDASSNSLQSVDRIVGGAGQFPTFAALAKPLSAGYSGYGGAFVANKLSAVSHIRSGNFNSHQQPFIPATLYLPGNSYLSGVQPVYAFHAPPPPGQPAPARFPVYSTTFRPVRPSSQADYLPAFEESEPETIGVIEKVDQFGTDEPDSLTKLTLSDLEWLPNVLNESGLYLPMGENGTEEIYQLGVNETNKAYDSCSTPLGLPGHCRHLPHCVLRGFADDFGSFLDFFCKIDSFAGVCCPDDVEKTTEEKDINSLIEATTSEQEVNTSSEH